MATVAVANPFDSPFTACDAASHRVYSDWCEENGYDYNAAVSRLAATCLEGDFRLLNEANMGLRVCVRNSFLQSLGLDSGAVRKAIGNANGTRRIRLLEFSNVFACIVAAARSDFGWSAIGGGTVSSAYGHSAVQTACLAARRTDGTIRLAIGVVGARKGSSLTNRLCGLTKSATDEAYRLWADAGK